MYALIEYKGKQYKAEKDALIQVDKISMDDGASLEIDTVVFVNDGKNVHVGTPYVTGAKVNAVIENSFRDKKVLVYKEKSKKDYHKTIGHRQHYTNILIKDIILGGKSSASKKTTPETEGVTEAKSEKKTKAKTEKTAE